HTEENEGKILNSGALLPIVDLFHAKEAAVQEQAALLLSNLSCNGISSVFSLSLSLSLYLSLSLSLSFLPLLYFICFLISCLQNKSVRISATVVSQRPLFPRFPPPIPQFRSRPRA